MNKIMEIYHKKTKFLFLLILFSLNLFSQNSDQKNRLY